MSAQPYLDTIERTTGHTPRTLVARAHDHGFGSNSRVGEIRTWFMDEFGLGHGHATAMAQVVRFGDSIDVTTAATATGPKPPASMGLLWLDGAATNPAAS
jgi:hypothetical protein